MTLNNNAIDKIKLSNFTVFDDLEIDLSAKVNVIIGCNGTGKTHLMKAAYACAGHGVEASEDAEQQIEASVTQRLVRCFLPHEQKLAKLRRRTSDAELVENEDDGGDQTEISIDLSSGSILNFTFDRNSRELASEIGDGKTRKLAVDIPEPVFIPTKEVISFAKGFPSLYSRRELSFDQTYNDICLSLDVPTQRDDKLHPKSLWAIGAIDEICGGSFVFHGGGNITFQTSDAEYSANAVAEGFRKAGMLSQLLRNGVIEPGKTGTLFWDEPESNLNPKLMSLLVQILLELSRNGQQIVLATHEYVILKWFDLHSDKALDDHVVYHVLHEKDGEIAIESSEDYLSISPNPIADTFEELYDQDVKRSFGGQP